MSLHFWAQVAFILFIFWMIGDWKWPGNLFAKLLRPFGFERVTDLERLWLENERRSKK